MTMRCQSGVGASLCDAEGGRSYRSQDIYVVFWQEWQKYRDHLYRCCFKWMNGNHTDAEEALSRAAVKAWNKVEDGKYIVNNFKAWFTRLTHNLCVDIHRENNRGIRKVESIEAIAEAEGDKLASNYENPILAATRQELDFLAKNAIEKLPPRLREVFIPYYYQDQSYREIAEEIGISYTNVCKRISQARAILKKELRGYVKDEVFSDFPAPKGLKSQETIPQQSLEIEVLVSVGELEDVSLVAGDIPEDTELLVPEIETVIDRAESEEETGENRGDDSAGNESAFPLSDRKLPPALVLPSAESIDVYEIGVFKTNHEATGEYIRGEMSRMGCVGAVCQGERKKAIIALESAINLESDQMAYWLVLGQLQKGREDGVGVLGAFDGMEMISFAPHGGEARKSLGCDQIFRGDWGEGVEVLGEFSTEHSYDSDGFFCFPPW